MTWPIQDGTFELGDFEVERGGVIRQARLRWQSHGTLNAARDNVIMYPCSYTATHEGLSWLIGPDKILDPERWFIVIPDMFSNGLSSSAADDPEFPPLVTMRDNVLAQHRLLSEFFGVDHIAAAYGFSMGAGQSYHWAAEFPEMVERAIIVCGSAPKPQPTTKSSSPVYCEHWKLHLNISEAATSRPNQSPPFEHSAISTPDGV